MPFDAPMAEPAPTRRSSRTPSSPAQASSETLGASRAELRRRTVQPQPAAGVWDAPSDEKRKDAASAEIATSQSLTDLPAASTVEPEAVIPTAPVVNLAAAPLSRRARRATTAEQPAILVPTTAEQPAIVIAPAAEQSAILEPSAAEQFELLEPVVEPEAPAEIVLEVVDTPAQPSVPSRRQRAPRRPLDEVTVEAEIVTEPVVPAAAEEAVQSAQAQAAASVDEFEAAARLFSFTGEFAVPTSDAPVADAVADAVAEPAATEAKPHKVRRTPRPRRGTAFKRIAAASFSVGVMGIVGAVTVGMTTPAQAVAAASGVDASMMSIVAPGDTGSTDLGAGEIQAYVAPATVEAETLDRSGNYDTTTVAELASQAGISNFSSLFHNDPNSAIQWPFVVGVTMSYGFGMRDGKLHKGIDFTPGAGSPIQAIADGTVRVASEAGGDYGVHVIIDHVVDGQLISSHYAHMLYGSLKVVPGQKVTVGTVLGNTGNTGRSYGAHTHFELLMNGTTPIDPMPWLREHAGG